MISRIIEEIGLASRKIYRLNQFGITSRDGSRGADDGHRDDAHREKSNPMSRQTVCRPQRHANRQKDRQEQEKTTNFGWLFTP